MTSPTLRLVGRGFVSCWFVFGEGCVMHVCVIGSVYGSFEEIEHFLILVIICGFDWVLIIRRPKN